MRAVGAGENAAIAKPIDDVGGLERSGLARFTVEYQIDRQEKSGPAQIANQSIAGLQSLQALDEMRADAQGALLQLFFFKNIQNRKTSSAGDWIASKGAEKFHPIVKGIGDLQRGDNRRERKRIADGVAENDDIRNHALRFDSPEMPPQSPDLHLSLLD